GKSMTVESSMPSKKLRSNCPRFGRSYRLPPILMTVAIILQVVGQDSDHARKPHSRFCNSFLHYNDCEASASPGGTKFQQFLKGGRMSRCLIISGSLLLAL